MSNDFSMMFKKNFLVKILIFYVDIILIIIYNAFRKRIREFVTCKKTAPKYKSIYLDIKVL